MPLQRGNNLYTMEAANLFCGTNGESNHLRLVNVRLPGLEENYIDHRPGGAPVAIEVDVVINRLQCDFKLAGWNPAVDAMINAWSINSNQFWFFGAIRNRVTGKPYKAQATIFGRMGCARGMPFQRGTVYGSDYSIRGIIKYELIVAGSLVFDWDFFNNTLETATVGI